MVRLCRFSQLSPISRRRRDKSGGSSWRPGLRRRIVGPCSGHCGLTSLVVVHASHRKVVGASKGASDGLSQVISSLINRLPPSFYSPTWLENRGAVFGNPLRAIA